MRVNLKPVGQYTGMYNYYLLFICTSRSGFSAKEDFMGFYFVFFIYYIILYDHRYFQILFLYILTY
jgi:hypothetical protein